MGKKITKNLTEKWKKIEFESPRKLYAVSNLGRIASYVEGLYKDGEEVLLNKSERGFRFLPKLPANKQGVRITKSFKVHRLVAMAFVKNASKVRDVVAHINHNVYDNKVANLKWLTRQELSAHSKTNPKKKAVAKKAVVKKSVVKKKVAVKKKAAVKSIIRRKR